VLPDRLGAKSRSSWLQRSRAACFGCLLSVLRPLPSRFVFSCSTAKGVRYAALRIWKCPNEAISGRDLIVFRRCCGYDMSVSLTKIEEAVKELSREELAKLAAFIARQDKLVWDEELEQDFSPGGKHSGALEKIDAEIDAENFRPMP
jgi:hypothetical protein